MKFEPGDLITVWVKSTFWFDELQIRDEHDAHPGDLLVFLGRSKYKFIRVMHPILGVRLIHRSSVVPVQPAADHGITG